MKDIIGPGIPREERDGDGDIIMSSEAGLSSKIDLHL